MVHRNDKVLGLAIVGLALAAVTLFLVSVSLSGSDGLPVSRDSVAVVDIVGPIIGSESVVDDIERYVRNDRIPAILIRLDTPGGAVAPTQEIYSAVLRARDAGKVVVASMGSVAASGGYYIAAACDSVVANPGTITGSIGVIIDFAEFSRLLDKIGVGFTVIKSGKYKDIGSFSREMTEEERELIRGVIMDTYDQFVEAVATGRNMTPEEVRVYADGRVFTGRQAREYGFVDVLGTYRDALNMAGRMAGIGENPPVIEQEDSRIWDMVLKGMTNILVRGFYLSVPRVSYRMY